MYRRLHGTHLVDYTTPDASSRQRLLSAYRRQLVVPRSSLVVECSPLRVVDLKLVTGFSTGLNAEYRQL